jgi:hypothetical protein
VWRPIELVQKTKTRAWNSIVEVRARNVKDNDAKEQFGTKERSLLEPFEQKKETDSFRNKKSNVEVKIWDT